MRILLLTQLFQPEPNHLKGLAFAKELAQRGHEVEVLTGFPNYPSGSIYPGYRIRPWMREIMDGIPVTRVMMYPSHDESTLRRIACYTSFAFSSAILGPLLIKRPDVVHVYQGPATLGWPAVVFRTMLGIPYVLDIQDLWPESVSSTGMLPIPGVSDVLRLWSKLTYRMAQKIVVLSAGYRDRLVGQGVPSSKIQVIYNWCNEQTVPSEDDPQGSDPFDLQGHFNIVYAGNFGAVQSLKTVLDAACLVADRHPNIRFVLVGDGIESRRLKAIAAERCQENVMFIPRQSLNMVKKIIASADALLVHLKDDSLARIGIPQKTQAALAAGKPVIMAVRGSSADLVRDAGAGIICRPNNPMDIAEAAIKLADLSQDKLHSIGTRGREFYKKYLAFSIGIEKMISIFEETSMFI